MKGRQSRYVTGGESFAEIARLPSGAVVRLCLNTGLEDALRGTVAKLAMRQPFVLFKGLTFQKLCLPGAFRPGDHHNKMLRPGLCVVHASPQYL
ncbi:hypothetical protein CVO25_23095 [Salmonella enterica subsp. enterica serovar Give]|nr:hypothetical protein [Salmonella enterica subsp. enterica serovar Give]